MQHLNNNIELAKALNDCKVQIQTLKIENQQMCWHLMNSKRYLQVSISKISDLQLELSENQKLNGELLVKINVQDEELKELRQLLKSKNDQSTIDSNASASNSKFASNIDISNDIRSFFHSTSLGRTNEIDSSELNISTTDGSSYSLANVIEQENESPIKPSSTRTDQSLTPRIIVTDIDNHTPNIVKKHDRKPHDGFQAVPRPSSGFTMKSPRSSFKKNTSDTQQLPIRVRSNSLSRIVETSTNLSGLGGLSHTQSSPNPVHSTIKVNQSIESIKSSSSMNVNMNDASVSSPKSPFMDSTNKQSQTNNSAGTLGILDNRLRVKNRLKNTSSVNKLERSKNVSIRNQNSKNSSIVPTEDSIEDSIANHRPTRRAAPKDLRDPVMLLISRSKNKP